MRHEFDPDCGRESACSLALLLVLSTLATPVAIADPGIVITTPVTPTGLVNTLLGPSGPIVSNVTFTGSNLGAGTFSGGTGILGFESGIILSSGKVSDVVGPNTSGSTTTSLGTAGDPDLDSIQPFPTFDATVLEFDFECPDIDVISFQYVFTSEEYNEFVNTPFNNVFGFFLNGVNIALLPDNVTPVSINNVNGGNPFGVGASNPAFYINNDCFDPACPIDIEADGLTVVLGAQATLNPGANHIKLAISDAGDSILDSWVFIKAGSFECGELNQSPEAVCQNFTKSADANCQADVTPQEIDGGSSDPDGDPITLTLSPAGPYALGSTTVTLTVTDDDGESDTCTATVTVVDNESPVITCPSDIVQSNDIDSCGAVVSWATQVATDNCGVDSVVRNPPTGSSFPIGTAPVQCIAYDPAGLDCLGLRTRDDGVQMVAVESIRERATPKPADVRELPFTAPNGRIDVRKRMANEGQLSHQATATATWRDTASVSPDAPS